MKRSIRVFHLPSLRAERIRAYRYRSRLQDGVIHVRIVQIGDLPPDAPVGALLPEPTRPPCDIQGCQDEANYHYNGGHFCWRHAPKPEYCGPEHPEPPTEYKHLYCSDCGKSICFVPLSDYSGALYFCKSCQRNVHVIEDVAPLSPAEQQEAESADNWAKTLLPSPPWPAVPDAPELSPDRDPDRCPWCGCPTDPDEDCEICGHHNYLIERPEQWPGGAA